ncbi:MAG: (deoxy)nucleoside triphosphate pyrophosphohydrolase [Mycobacteriales bacterium]
MSGEPVVVVGAAILDVAGGTPRVLAAQRAHPSDLAGWWEFPGGKVEPGETERDALVRECREELGVEITVADRLGGDLPIGDGGAVLRVWTATVRRGQPRPVEHAATRWLTAEELYDVDWLAADLPLIDLLRPLLQRHHAGHQPYS